MSEQSPSIIQPLHLGLLAVAVLGLLFVWLWPSDPQEPVTTEVIEITEPAAPAQLPEPAPSPKPGVVAPPETPEVPPEVTKREPVEPKAPPLPTLNNSDQALLAELQDASVLPLLTNEFLLRKTVRAIVAAANGEWVNQHYPVTPPQTPFKANKGANLTISPDNFDRYTTYIDAAESLGADAWVALYQRYTPLLQEAYEELGLKEASFDTVLKRALKQVQAAPFYENQALARPSVMYAYKDKTLENLPEIQKMVMRLGPDNQKRLQALCSKITLRLQ